MKAILCLVAVTFTQAYDFGGPSRHPGWAPPGAGDGRQAQINTLSLLLTHDSSRSMSYVEHAGKSWVSSSLWERYQP